MTNQSDLNDGSRRNILQMFPKKGGQGPTDKGGGPPYDHDMEPRVKALEDALSQVRTDVAVVRSNYASKEDLHREIHAQTWRVIAWVGGIATALVAATFLIATKI